RNNRLDPTFRSRPESAIHRDKESQQRERRERASYDPHRAEGPGFLWNHCVGSLAQRNEHGIPGWVGLMARDIEFANAEREVDRVEILESGGQIRKMSDEEEQRAGERYGVMKSAECRMVVMPALYMHCAFCISPVAYAGCSNRPSLRLPVR